MRRKRLARIDGSHGTSQLSVGSSQTPLSQTLTQPLTQQQTEVGHENQSLNQNESIACSEFPSKNETKEDIKEEIDCNKDCDNSLKNCSETESESEKSKWPANQLEDIENKSDLLSENSTLKSGFATNAEEECVAMEVESEYYSDKNHLNSGVESMEVDAIEKRESLKRQRESTFSTDANELLPISVKSLNTSLTGKPSFDETAFQMISKVFCVQWTDTDIDCQLFRLALDPSVISDNYPNLSQTILMEVINQIINCSDYEKALKIYTNLKPKPKTEENGFIGTNDLSFPKELFRKEDKSVLVFCYLLECFGRLSHEISLFGDNNRLNDILVKIKDQIIDLSVIAVTNSFVRQSVSNFDQNSILAQFLLTQSLPSGFISSLVCSTYQTDIERNTNTFKAIFAPTLQILWQEMQSSGSLANELSHKQPLRALNELCLITYREKSVRPVCQLV